jgi:hypothetical protein
MTTFISVLRISWLMLEEVALGAAACAAGNLQFSKVRA